MASPGYGKRTTPGQPAASAHDFDHLTEREAYVAEFIDALPDGADISVKGLAKVLPFGQCALRTILNRLQAHGHLRRGREHLTGPDGARWVTRTWFSPARRDTAWWTTFTSGSGPGTGQALTNQPTTTPLFNNAPYEGEDEPDHDDRPDDTICLTPTAGVPVAARVPVAPAALYDEPPSATLTAAAPAALVRPASPYARRSDRIYSPAYSVLVELGRRAPAVSLSAADCAGLEPLAAEWFTRGATPEQLLRSLTDGLPAPVHHAAALIRRRLISKLPPEPLLTHVPGAERSLRIMECATCGAPGRPDALHNGECGTCRGEPEPTRRPTALPPDHVRARAAEARAAATRTP